ncbi:hypothetical protein JHW43_003538 [Diplocarpon mali]|nr:hypothetical protein JHW43_003538 [Diplocarpon mali]
MSSPDWNPPDTTALVFLRAFVPGRWESCSVGSREALVAHWGTTRWHGKVHIGHVEASSTPPWGSIGGRRLGETRNPHSAAEVFPDGRAQRTQDATGAWPMRARAA